MKDSFLENIKTKINKGEEISPFLFLSDNLEILDAEVNTLASELLGSYGIWKEHLFCLKDNSESIKIKNMKVFLEKSHQKSSFKFQIFFIENISRMTLKAANASLKFLEEPWIWNIVFLTIEFIPSAPKRIWEFILCMCYM